jgi:DNA primase
MLNHPLIALVNSVLGTGKPTSKGNYAYVCPFHTSNPPGKKNLEINMGESKDGTNKWHCWGCDARGKKIHQIFKKLNVGQDKIHELNSIVKSESNHVEYVSQEKVELPKEFQPLTNISKSNIIGRHALTYIKSRNITEEDILKYNIGYCESGPYRNMVVIPSYDADGRLNYFTGRSFEKEAKVKYKNPTVSRDIIPFELFINWDIPFILCEGPFDAIAIKRNVIPLLGKNIQTKLMKKIVMSSVDKIYIALDRDAQKQALSFCEQLMNEGKEVYLVDMQDKDPSEMGFKNFINLISETYPLTFSGLLEKKFYL